MLRLALTAAVALALVAPAQAATWSPATPPYSCPAGFGYTQAGRGIAISGVQSAADGGGVPAQIDAVWGELVPETVYGKIGKLPFEPLGLGLFRSDGFGAIGYVGRNGTRRPPLREYALLGHVATGAGRAHRLGRARYDIPGPLAITVSASGKAVALFGGTRGAVTEFLLATNGFTKTTLIARGRSVGGSTLTNLAGGAALAGNSRGDVVIAWRNGSNVYARMRTASGKLLEPQRLGAARRLMTMRVAVAEDGKAVVAWATAGSASHMLIGPEVVSASYRAPGGRFRTRVLDRSAPFVFGDTSPVGVGFAGRRAIVAWTAAKAGGGVVLADVDGSGPIQVSPAGTSAHLGDVAGDPAGIGAVSWTTMGTDLPYLSMLLPNASAFGDAERISDHNAYDTALLAVDPVSGAILAVGPSSPVGCWFSWRMP